MDRRVTVGDIAKELECEVVAGKSCLDNEVSFGYSSDLLSDVMAGAGPGDVWVTVQVHQNIIAVASLTDLRDYCRRGAAPADETVLRANEEGIPLLTTAKPSLRWQAGCTAWVSEAG